MTGLLLGGAAAYGLTLGGLYLMQDGLIFPRSMAALSAYPLPAGTLTIELETGDGDRIAGRLLRRPEPRALLLGFGGNAWNGDDLLAWLARRLPDVDIAVFHYRGYAPSQGEPSERALYADALLAHDHLVERLAPARVVGLGFSLGSAVVAHLAAMRPLTGLVLATPFDSLQAIARERYPWAPVERLLRHPFRADLDLAGLDLPVAVLLASDDQVVPAARSRALIDLLERPVLVETIAGSGHAGLYELPATDDALRRGLDAVLAAATEPAP